MCVLHSRCASHAPLAMQPVASFDHGNFIRYCQEAPNIQNLNIPHNVTGALLHGNFITQLTANDFEHIENVYIIDLSYNYIHHIDHGVFNGIPMLQHLYLGFNNISYLDEQIFSKLSDLVMLDISHNSLVSLPLQIFHGLKSLFGLHMCCNKFQIIQRGLLSQLPSLTFLDVTGNLIHTVEPQSLEALTSLQSLLLRNNNLTSLSWNIFSSSNNRTGWHPSTLEVSLLRYRI